MGQTSFSDCERIRERDLGVPGRRALGGREAQRSKRIWLRVGPAEPTRPASARPPACCGATPLEELGFPIVLPSRVCDWRRTMQVGAAAAAVAATVVLSVTVGRRSNRGRSSSSVAPRAANGPGRVSRSPRGTSSGCCNERPSPPFQRRAFRRARRSSSLVSGCPDRLSRAEEPSLALASSSSTRRQETHARTERPEARPNRRDQGRRDRRRVPGRPPRDLYRTADRDPGAGRAGGTHPDRRGAAASRRRPRPRRGDGLHGRPGARARGARHRAADLGSGRRRHARPHLERHRRAGRREAGRHRRTPSAGRSIAIRRSSPSSRRRSRSSRPVSR